MRRLHRRTLTVTLIAAGLSLIEVAAQEAKPPAATMDAAKGVASAAAPGHPLPSSLPAAAKGVATPTPDFGAAVQTITAPHDEPFLPAGPGREAFVSHCLACHSPRYVTNQPVFPRKTWGKEVKKMAEIYGAPIEAGQMPAITDYLVFFHGKEDDKP